MPTHWHDAAVRGAEQRAQLRGGDVGAGQLRQRRHGPFVPLYREDAKLTERPSLREQQVSQQPKL